MARVKLTSKMIEGDKLMGNQKMGTTAMARCSYLFVGVGSKGSVDAFIVEVL